ELTAGTGHCASDLDDGFPPQLADIGTDIGRTGAARIAPLQLTLHAYALHGWVNNGNPFSHPVIRHEHQAYGAQPYHHGIGARVIGAVGRTIEGARVERNVAEATAIH